MKNSMLGIIDATVDFPSLLPISQQRTLAAVPVGGRYRLIDFMLSNMVNSDITCVGIFPRSQCRSLMDHLGSGKQWDLDRKRNGMFMLTPRCEDGMLGTFHHMQGHIDFLLRAHHKYVCIAPANIVSCMDFKPILKRHIEEENEITEVVYNNKSLNIYIIERQLLIQLIQDKTPAARLEEIIQHEQNIYRIGQFEYTGYVSVIDSLHTYYQTNLQLINPEQWKLLFKPEFPIYTKVKDEPPTRYRKEAKVTNSIVANGADIEGSVENSVLFRSVKVGKGTVIRNSIIMQKCQIGENCLIEGVILDKDVKVEDGQRLVVSDHNPVVLEKGSIQGEMIRK